MTKEYAPYWASVLQGFGDYCVAQGASTKSAITYQYRLKLFLASLPPTVRIPDLRWSHFQSFVRQISGKPLEPLAYARRMNYMRSLRTPLRHFLMYLFIEYDIKIKIPPGSFRFPSPQPQLVPLTAIEFRRLLTAASNLGTRYYLAISLMAYAGLRLAEVAQLRGRDITPNQEYIIVEAGKGLRGRSLAICRPLHRALQVWLETEQSRDPDAPVIQRQYDDKMARISGLPPAPLTTNMLGRMVGQVFSAARVKGSAHRLRHHFAHVLEDSHVDVRTIQLAMGHSSITTTQRYLRASSTGMGSAIIRAFGA